MQEEYQEEEGSVVGSDFYGATELLGLTDSQIVDKVVRNITRCEPRLKGAKVKPLVGLPLGMICKRPCHVYCLFLQQVRVVAHLVLPKIDFVPLIVERGCSAQKVDSASSLSRNLVPGVKSS